MNEHLAIELAREAMKEQNIETYILRYRHLIMPANSTKTIDAESQTLFFINPPSSITIRSRTGVFDLLDEKVSELQYVHVGKVMLQNTISQRAFITFLQVIIPLKQ